MQLKEFHVRNYRNIHDSGPIETGRITAFVGQNEAGKSNLFEALHRINPLNGRDAYAIEEDWPVDRWRDRDPSALVCEAKFTLTGSEIFSLFEATANLPRDANNQPQPALRPAELSLLAARTYTGPTTYRVSDPDLPLDAARVTTWAQANVPKFVYVHDYEFSGATIELDHLQRRKQSTAWNQLTNEEQTILILLDLAKVDLDEFVARGSSPQGRTIRTFDKRSASAYLTNRFQELWRWSQRQVAFELEIDGPTFNVLVTDSAVGMPVRLNRRSTGFRWYVSFAWKFTHASDGQFKNCVLLLEEPGIHLHYSAQADLLQVFERLKEANSILYTTHLASMVDLANPERVRIVESRDGRAIVKPGVVSSQKGPMAVIEMALGLSGEMGGLLGNRKTLIVEGGDDALILRKLTGLLATAGRGSLSDEIYLWPALGASKTPMYAAFAIGHRWHSGVLLDSDEAGRDAAGKIRDLYLSKLDEGDHHLFRVLMLGDAADIRKNECAIEDLLPDEFYLGLVSEAYRLRISMSDLPADGSEMITKRIDRALKDRFGRSGLDKAIVLPELLKRFDTWRTVEDLPDGTAAKAQRLFERINAAFAPR